MSAEELEIQIRKLSRRIFLLEIMAVGLFLRLLADFYVLFVK